MSLSPVNHCDTSQSLAPVSSGMQKKADSAFLSSVFLCPIKQQDKIDDKIRNLKIRSESSL